MNFKRGHVFIGIILMALTGTAQAMAKEVLKAEGLTQEDVEAIVDKKLDEKSHKWGKISGQIFGDFFWNAKRHSKVDEGDTGFWIRRGYLTYDYAFNEAWGTRFRLEVNSRDLTKTSDNMTPYVKEASLTWKPNRHAVMVGMIPTPTWLGLVEDQWGYRSIEKTPIDLQRLGSAVDLGVGIKGAFGKDEFFGYHLVFGNGTGTRSETNNSKKVYAALYIRPVKDLVVQAYGDAEPGKHNSSRYTFYGFTGYTRPALRLGLLFGARLTGRPSAKGYSDLRLASAHGAFKIVKKLWGFARVDRLFDPNPDGDTIDYLPFMPGAKATFSVGGVDWEPIKDVHFMPNVETIFYDKVAGSRPGTVLVPRITFYWKF